MSFKSYSYNHIRPVDASDEKGMQDFAAEASKRYVPRACRIGKVLDQQLTGSCYVSAFDAYEVVFQMAPEGADAFVYRAQAYVSEGSSFFGFFAKIFQQDAFPSYSTVRLDNKGVLKAERINREGLPYLIPHKEVIAAPSPDPEKMIVIVDVPAGAATDSRTFLMDKPLFDALYREPQKPTTPPRQPGTVATAENV